MGKLNTQGPIYCTTDNNNHLQISLHNDDNEVVWWIRSCSCGGVAQCIYCSLTLNDIFCVSRSTVTGSTPSLGLVSFLCSQSSGNWFRTYLARVSKRAGSLELCILTFFAFTRVDSIPIWNQWNLKCTMLQMATTSLFLNVLAQSVLGNLGPISLSLKMS